MNRAELSEIEGKTLLYMDFSDLSNPQEFELVIAEAEAIRLALPKKDKDDLLLIADFSRAMFSPDVYDLMARYSRLANSTNLLHALVGIRTTSLIKVILKTYTGKDVQTFDTVKAAKNWFFNEIHNKLKKAKK